MNLISLQFKTTSSFQNNLDKLISLINKSEPNAFILAPELCLNGYAYDRLDEAFDISTEAIPILLALSVDKTISLTLTIKEEGEYFNTLYIFSYGEILHTQSKVKLFSLGDEHKYFSSGDVDDIKIVKIDGIRVASLICFELRFSELWEKLKGADIILVPAMWGKLRAEHYISLTKSLAIMNQCYVIASDSSNEDMASGSGIISPFGEEVRDDSLELISASFDLKQIKKMRRYLDTGI